MPLGWEPGKIWKELGTRAAAPHACWPGATALPAQVPFEADLRQESDQVFSSGIPGYLLYNKYLFCVLDNKKLL